MRTRRIWASVAAILCACGLIGPVSRAVADAASDTVASGQRYDGVSFYLLDADRGEWLPYVLQHLSDPDVNARLRNTFTTYERLGINLIRLVIAPHWWDDDHWFHLNLCGANRPFDFPAVYLPFEQIYPPGSAYPDSVPQLDATIAQTNALMNIAAEYGLATSITFTPPQVCTGVNPRFMDLHRDILWLNRWLEGLSVNPNLVLVNLLGDIVIMEPSGHAFSTEPLLPDIGYTLSAPIFRLHPNVTPGSVAQNNSAHALAVWAWFKPAFPHLPATFEFPTFAWPTDRGYSTRLMSDVSNWIHRNMPDLSAGSVVLYFATWCCLSSQEDFNRAAEAMTETYFNSLLYHNTGMPLWVDEYGVALCDPGNAQCIAAVTSTLDPAVQTAYTQAILAHTQGSDERTVKGRVLWHPIVTGYDYTADPAGVPIVQGNYASLFGMYFESPPDSDADDVPDSRDNCLAVANPTQRDTDGDHIGNACDADLNNDCVVNALDLGLFRQVFFSADPDADFNGDGFVNALDLGIMKTRFFGPPGPSGTPNVCGPSGIYRVGVDYHATDADFPADSFIRHYADVRGDVQVQLKAMADSGARIISTRLWQVDDLLSPSPDTDPAANWQLPFPLAGPVLQNITDFATDVANTQAEDGHYLDLEVTLLWLGFANYHVETVDGNIGGCLPYRPQSWAQFDQRARTSIDNLFAALQGVTRPDGSDVVTLVYLDGEINVTFDRRGVLYPHDDICPDSDYPDLNEAPRTDDHLFLKKNGDRFLSDLLPYFTAQGVAAGIPTSLYFTAEMFEASILDDNYSNTALPQLNGHKSAVVVYQTANFLAAENLPGLTQINLSFYPEPDSTSYAALVDRTMADFSALFPSLAVGVVETAHPCASFVEYLRTSGVLGRLCVGGPSAQRDLLGQAFYLSGWHTGRPNKLTFWTTPYGVAGDGGSGADVMFADYDIDDFIP